MASLLHAVETSSRTTCHSDCPLKLHGSWAVFPSFTASKSMSDTSLAKREIVFSLKITRGGEVINASWEVGRSTWGIFNTPTQ